MPCMCGDYYCGSCGPAQGNYKCSVCGMWYADGGCENPEKCEEEARIADEELEQQLEEAERFAEEYWRNHS